MTGNMRVCPVYMSPYSDSYDLYFDPLHKEKKAKLAYVFIFCSGSPFFFLWSQQIVILELSNAYKCVYI